MRRKLKGFLIAFLLIPTVSFIIFYLFVSLYYTDGFTFNTRINGVYCTGKSVEKVNEELVEAAKAEAINIKCARYETEEIISLSDIDYSIDYTDALNEIFGKQNPFLWIFNSSKSSVTASVKPTVTYSDEKLYKSIENLEIVKAHKDNAHFECELIYTKDNGYFLKEHIDELINVDKVFELAKTSVTNDLTVDLKDDCFFDRKETKEMLHDRKVWGEIKGYLTNNFSYDMGDEPILLDSGILSTFLVYDETTREFAKDDDGSLYINRVAVDKYIDDLFDKYDTYEKPRKFVTHQGEVKEINFSIYGTLLDRKTEKDYLYNALKNGESGVHIPKYIKEPFSRGINDIGNTYVEVDLTRQMLYYIKDGETEMTCDIVSGKPSAGYATPEMVCYINKKIAGKYLRGDDYCTWVDYWMPIYKAIGLHDAKWQSKYGGNRYLTHGSRGCINMRPEDAKTLYYNIEVGTPVIVYK